MAILALPVDQRVIDIDSRRFASIEKALVELITNSDDSYSRLEKQNIPVSGNITVCYDRHQNGAILTASDQSEGMCLDRLRSVLSYGGAHSLLSKGEASGRGYFGRGMKQAVYGLGHGWIESVYNGRFCRVDLFRAELGNYVYDDWDGDKPATEEDYNRLNIPNGYNGTKVTIIVDNPQVNIPYFRSLVTAVNNNVYLRDLLERRNVELINRNRSAKTSAKVLLRYEAPESDLLLGPNLPKSFVFQETEYPFFLTLRKAHNTDLILKGDERTNGLLVISGTAVLDCQFFRYENQLGTEYLFGKVSCPGLAEMLGKGRPVISDERDGLNLKEPFVEAFAKAVSDTIEPLVQQERFRLSHIDHASTSKRTGVLIEKILQKMNTIATEELGIILPPGPGSGKNGPFDTGRSAVLRFTTPFYYRQAGHRFRVTVIIDKAQLIDQDIILFTYDLPESIKIEPALTETTAAKLPADGRLEFNVIGSEIGASGKITVATGPYSATSEIVIAAEDTGKGYSQPSGTPPAKLNNDNATALFVGYELRNLDNDIDRAIYKPDERLILINTEAPTVRLYVDGQGHFRDGARLLLAELFLDVISAELAQLYVDRTTQKGVLEAYHEAKQTFIKRYGVEIHQIMMGG
ncbi:MAG: ATP-binding protein [Negativicutes bacterium]|nr:ATP-binding protein [Negativicutes bacterium]